MADFYYLDAQENPYEPTVMGAQVIWKDKPTLEHVANALGQRWPSSSDDLILKIVKIWSGEKARISDVDYSIESGKFGESIVG